MANNLLSRFGSNLSTTYIPDGGIRYSDAYWSNDAQDMREQGFIANTPISPIQMNTILSQTTLVSYIIGNVLADNTIIVDKENSSLITQQNITSEILEDSDVMSYYITPFKEFLNRINDISGNGGIGTESVWRSRQLGYTDTSNYWYSDANNVLLSNGSSHIVKITNIRYSNSDSDAVTIQTQGIDISTSVNITGNSTVSGTSTSDNVSTNRLNEIPTTNIFETDKTTVKTATLAHGSQSLVLVWNSVNFATGGHQTPYVYLSTGLYAIYCIIDGIYCSCGLVYIRNSSHNTFICSYPSSETGATITGFLMEYTNANYFYYAGGTFDLVTLYYAKIA